MDGRETSAHSFHHRCWAPLLGVDKDVREAADRGDGVASLGELVGDEHEPTTRSDSSPTHKSHFVGHTRVAQLAHAEAEVDHLGEGQGGEVVALRRDDKAYGVGVRRVRRLEGAALDEIAVHHRVDAGEELGLGPSLKGAQ